MSQLFYDDWIRPPAPPAPTPTSGLIPPAFCPQPCPVRVDLDFCAPPPWPRTTDDRWGDPRSIVPPGVRTEPYWTPGAIKASPGGPVLMGPQGAYIYPAPQLPAGATGRPVAAGGVLDPGGALRAREMIAPIDAPWYARTPWWAWTIAAVVAAKVLGGR